MFCNKCGAQLPDGSGFCSNCGSKADTTVPTMSPDPYYNQQTAVYDNDLAQSAMVKGIVGVALAVFGIPGIILGTMAKNAASQFAYSNGGRLFGKAKVGSILGRVALGVGIGFTCFWAFYFILIVGIISSLS
ncbi:MAG: zinc ribbon domain-containing protein [Ruminococcaceae bacterium]|nr:zinc ribbon domain-containing protein [Oscillospiraceae bacterium]